MEATHEPIPRRTEGVTVAVNNSRLALLTKTHWAAHCKHPGVSRRSTTSIITVHHISCHDGLQRESR